MPNHKFAVPAEATYPVHLDGELLPYEWTTRRALMRRSGLKPALRKKTAGVVLMMALHGCGPTSSEPLSGRPVPPASVIAEVDWPPLPTDGFVSDRAATRDDVAKGHAAVAAQSQGDGIAVAIPGSVPQYAFHVDANGMRTPGIVIQAEQAGHLRIIGFKPLSGEGLLAALENEFEFLGTEVGARPKVPSH